jgi:5'-nucleotidase
MLRGVFFDLDNTLIPTREVERAALAASWAAVFGSSGAMDPIALQKAIRNVYETRFGYGTPGYVELADLSAEKLAAELWTDVLAPWGLPAGDAVERLIHAYSEAERALLAPTAGALDTLDTLRAAGLKLGLITNGASAIQRRKLKVLAWEDFFDTVVVDTEFGHPKPDCRIFDHAAAAVGLPPAELMIVGDHLTADIGGGRSAGWRAVWYNAERKPLPPDAAPPDQTIHTLAELLTLPEIETMLRRTGESRADAPSGPVPSPRACRRSACGSPGRRRVTHN